MLVEVGRAVENTTGLYSYYREDDEDALEEALRALELPRWGSIETFGHKRPGSGFNNSAVLAAGKTLGDLATWLEARSTLREPASGCGKLRPR